MSIMTTTTEGKEKEALSLEEVAEKLGIEVSEIPDFLKAHSGIQLLQDEEYTGEQYILTEEVKPYFTH